MLTQIRQYKLLQEIGAGSYSFVYRALDRNTNKIVAIKKMKQLPSNTEKAVKNEINLLNRIKHKNIIRYEGDFKQKGKWYIVFEYCGKGDLQHFRDKQQKIPEFVCKNFIYNIVDAVQTLHQNKIVHRDLKLPNILINDSYEIKLADFGFSRDYQDGLMKSFCGTPLTMAPEILQKKQDDSSTDSSYDEKCDTWSIGVIAYQLLYGKSPFMPNKQYGQGIWGLINCVLKSQPKLPEGSNNCKDFMMQCLIKDPHKRPSMTKLKAHPWFMEGVESKIRIGYLSEKMIDFTEVKSMVLEALKAAIQSHIKKILQKALLNESAIKQNYKYLVKTYQQQKNIHNYFNISILKKIQSLQQIKIHIIIEGRRMSIKLSQINIYKNYINNLIEFIKQSMKDKEIKEQKVNIEREIIKFCLKQSKQYLPFIDPKCEKHKLLQFLSEINLGRITQSQLTMKEGLQLEDEVRRNFDLYLDKMKDQDPLKLINDLEDTNTSEASIRKNWLLEDSIFTKNYQGLDAEISDIISAILCVNDD